MNPFSLRCARLSRALAVAALAVAPLLASAQVFDAAVDFSSADNPAGPWAYGSTVTLGGSFEAYGTPGTVFYGASSWNAGAVTFPGMYPLVFHNGTAAAIDYGSGAVLPGELGLHPGNDGRFSIVRWTAPQAGSFRVEATFTRDDAGMTDAHVLKNQLALHAAALDASHPVSSFSQTVVLAAGDHLDFAVGFGADGTFNGDTVDLSVRIAAVPEPAAWAAMLGGLGMLLALRRRRATAQV
jgi:hypothetical protein